MICTLSTPDYYIIFYYNLQFNFLIESYIKNKNYLKFSAH